MPQRGHGRPSPLTPYHDPSWDMTNARYYDLIHPPNPVRYVSLDDLGIDLDDIEVGSRRRCIVREMSVPLREIPPKRRLFFCHPAAETARLRAMGGREK